MDVRGPSDLNLLHTVGYAAFASVGGMVGYILRTMDAQQPVSARRLIVETVASGFVGSLAMLACNALNVSSTWTGVIVGMSGWIGATASIRLIETLVYKRLGISREDVAVVEDMQHVVDNHKPDNK